jgi:hypothetical protein
MAVMAGAVLPGVSARTLAEVSAAVGGLGSGHRLITGLLHAFDVWQLRQSSTCFLVDVGRCYTDRLSLSGACSTPACALLHQHSTSQCMHWPPLSCRPVLLLLLLLLQVLLSDQSGFLPSVYQAQGNELVSLTPWQVRGLQQACARAVRVWRESAPLFQTARGTYSAHH